MLDKKIILALGVSAAAAIAGGLYLTTDIFQPPEKKAKNAVAYRNAEPASRSSPHILKKEVTPEKKEVLPPSKETFSAGTLAELTGLQADRDLSKMAVELKGYQLQLKEMDEKMASPPELPLASLALPAPPAPEKEKAAVPTSTEKLAVEAVKGSGRNLTATLRSKSGSHTVKVGDTVPGFGKVSTVSKDKVVVNGSPLPWM